MVEDTCQLSRLQPPRAPGPSPGLRAGGEQREIRTYRMDWKEQSAMKNSDRRKRELMLACLAAALVFMLAGCGS